MLSLVRQAVARNSRGAAAASTILTRSVRPLSSATSSSSDQDTTIKPPVSRYAVVDHSDAYEESMKGLHGQQLQLALLEGVGKDDAPFDPFWEEELEERERLAAAEQEEEEEEEEGEKEEGEEEEYSDDDDDDEQQQQRKQASPYNNDGSLKWKKSQLATFKAGAPAGGMFAIIELAGSQHKVTVDDVLVVNLLQPVKQYSLGSVHTLKDILLVGSSHLTLVGMPYVSGAEVDVMVEEITQDAKVIVFKKKRRKGYQRKKGHRRDVTMLRILDIRPPEEHSQHKHLLRQNPPNNNTNDGSTAETASVNVTATTSAAAVES